MYAFKIALAFSLMMSVAYADCLQPNQLIYPLECFQSIARPYTHHFVKHKVIVKHKKQDRFPITPLENFEQ